MFDFNRRRPTIALAALLLALVARAGVAADDGPHTSSRGMSKSVQVEAASLDAQLDKLIDELGSPQFAVRREAAIEIREIGPEAFDRLQVATQHRDPEIAASASYLLRQITVSWVGKNDSTIVRRLMRNYADRSDKDRQRIIQVLAIVPNGEGIGALCRVARFDSSLALSRWAALAVIGTIDTDKSSRTPDPELIGQEIGGSRRVATAWLRQYQMQLGDPSSSVAGWQQLIDEELQRVDSHSDETSSATVTTLMYFVANAHSRLGKADLAEQLAAQASQLEVRQTTGPLEEAVELATLGQQLISLGQFDWALREFRLGYGGQRPLESPVAVMARVNGSSLLQDYERYQEAAEALEPLAKELEKNQDLRQSYNGVKAELEQEDVYLPKVEQLMARYHYVLACHFAQEHGNKQQRKELLAAIEHDETDADVLIAMFRVADADDAWMADTRKRIEKLSEQTEKQIEENPNEAIYYNQWAWLIANTEGDFQKAVKYSRRSLELDPGTASFLDTLGRCYYSAGNVEKAVESQREAVRLIPHMQVMQRQLRQFEKALAEKKQKAEGGEQGAGTAD
jgi:tetratricopeptide (TPR) repeat protein